MSAIDEALRLAREVSEDYADGNATEHIKWSVTNTLATTLLVLNAECERMRDMIMGLPSANGRLDTENARMRVVHEEFNAAHGALTKEEVEALRWLMRLLRASPLRSDRDCEGALRALDKFLTCYTKAAS